MLKKQTRASQRNPIAFLRAISPSDLFMFSQIYFGCNGMWLRTVRKASGSAVDMTFGVRSTGAVVNTRKCTVSKGCEDEHETTYDVLGVRRQCDISPFWVLAAQDMGHNMGIGDSSHRRKPVVLCFACVDLRAVVFNRTLCAFELCAAHPSGVPSM